MAVYQVTATGTKTSGTSTPGDWATNSNNYGSISTAMNQGWTSADQIVLDDTTFSVTTLQTGISAALTGATLNIKSRSLNPETCIIDFTAATSTGLNLNHASKVFTVNIEGITLKKAVTQTSTTSATLLAIIAETADVTFTNCVIGPATLTDASSTARANAHFQINSHAGRTITFTGCTITGITSTLLGGYSIGRVTDGNTLRIVDTAISNITVNITGNNNHFGGIYGLGGALVLDGVTVTSVAMDHADTVTERLHNPLFTTSSACSMTVDGLTASSVTQSGNSGGPFLLRAEGTYTIANIRATDCSGTPDDGINSVGGLFLTYGDSATGTGQNITAIRCSSDYGPVIYASQGGNGQFSNITAIDCDARYDGMLYAGGWGDVTFDDFNVVNCSTGTDTTGSDGVGGAVYIHNHSTLSTRSKTTVVSNGHIIGCGNGQGGYPGILAKGQSASYAHNAFISNVVIDCPGYENPVGIVSLVGCTLNLAATGLQMDGDVYESLAGSGIVTHAQTSLAALPARRGVSRGNGVVRMAA